MNKRFCVGLIAGVLLLSAVAPAEQYYVRNRAFPGVVRVGSEPYAPADTFLRMLGYNWDVQGNTVRVTTSPAKNPPLAAGTYNFVFEDRNQSFELAPRGGANYVELKPLARFLGYTVSSNAAAGTVDINRGHFQTKTESQVAADTAKEKEERQKAIKEAWEKKAAELKEKREAAKKAKEEAEAASTDGDTDKDKDKDADKDASSKSTAKDKDKSSTAKSKDKDKAKETASADADKSTETATAATEPAKDDKKEKEPPPAPRLEVFSADATPDYSTGVVAIKAQVKNQGNGPAKSVSGVLTVTGTDTDGKSKVVWWRTNVRGPQLAPDQAWDYSSTYKHRLGSSMPQGPITVDLKLDPAK